MLTTRALNRTLLERQHLLRRTTLGVLDVVRHLVAVQAQEADSPYVQLWSRIEGFAVEDLTAQLRERTVVRGSLLRCTQHLTATEDYPWLRPLIAPMLARQAGYGRLTQPLDLAALAVAAREELADRTLTRPQLGRLLAERFPEHDPLALGWAAQGVLPVVHPAPEGTWRRRGATPFALADSWLGRDVDGPGDPRELIRRYLAAFGPATVADVQAWSRLTRLREVADGMRGELRTFTAEDGRELLDVPDAPVLTGDEPAPVRFIADFDNLLLGHADRTRVISDEDRARVIDGAAVLPTFLLDGFVAGTWEYRKGELTVTPFRALTPADQAAVDQEATNLHHLLTTSP